MMKMWYFIVEKIIVNLLSRERALEAIKKRGLTQRKQIIKS